MERVWKSGKPTVGCKRNRFTGKLFQYTVGLFLVEIEIVCGIPNILMT